MDIRIFTEPQQGASYAELLAVATATEEAGLDGFFRSDHVLRMGDGDRGWGPTEAWVTLAGLARDTERIRLGTLVSPVTFRNASMLATQVAQVDDMSGGRVELGLGTGWFGDEHTAYGLPFPSTGERFDMFADHLAVITGTWETPAGEMFEYSGPTLTVAENPGLPKPAQSPRPPIIIGGGGKKKTPALAARYADEFNHPFQPLDQAVERGNRVRAACEEIDRDPASMVHSAALVLCLGADEATIARRAAAIGREVDELTENGLAGPAEAIAEKLASYAEQAGVSRVYLQLLDLSDLDHVAEVGASLAPLVADL